MERERHSLCSRLLFSLWFFVHGVLLNVTSLCDRLPIKNAQKNPNGCISGNYRTSLFPFIHNSLLLIILNPLDRLRVIFFCTAVFHICLRKVISLILFRSHNPLSNWNSSFYKTDDTITSSLTVYFQIVSLSEEAEYTCIIEE